MGQLDMLKGFVPENITPQGAFGNPLSHTDFRATRPYANPEHFGFTPPGSFTVAGVYEVNGAEFVQDRWHWPTSNTQIVDVPPQPISKGTLNALMQNATGVYLQPRQIGIGHQYSGSAPTTGVYTGYYQQAGEYDNGGGIC